MVVGCRENVGSLESLRIEAEDVVDYEDGFGCVGGAGNVCGEGGVSSRWRAGGESKREELGAYDLNLIDRNRSGAGLTAGILTRLQTTNCLIFPLLLIILRNDWGNIAASSAVSVLSFHVV
jgi:hypothetical protein